MGRLDDKLLCVMEKNGSISQEDREVYAYALQGVRILGGNMLASLIIGIGLGVPWYCLLFLVAIFFLRSDAGGYHASNVWSCFFLSCLVLALSLLWIKLQIPNQVWLTAGAALPSFLVIFRYAPLESENKPLDEEERRIIGNRARRIVLIEMAAGLLCIPLDPRAACVIFSAIICTACGYAGWFLQKKKNCAGM